VLAGLGGVEGADCQRRGGAGGSRFGVATGRCEGPVALALSRKEREVVGLAGFGDEGDFVSAHK